MACRTGFITLVALVLIFLWAHLTEANDVVGCGGFVVSSVSINYVPIQIKLYTSRGILKYSSDCAPNNGYYFIPLYDIGEYILRIESPNGWSFDPMEVALNYDGKTDICSRQVDVNFAFKGFSIFGKVFSSASSSSGPSGVQVTLLSKQNNNIIRKNHTIENGLFSFHDILPGQYVIEASHKSWTFEQNRIIVDVVNDNVNLQNIEDPVANDQIRILGYSVSGQVVSDGQPINGVKFALFAQETPLKKFPCDESSKPSFVAKLPTSVPLKYLCSAASNSGGIFQFKTVPVGKYVLYTFYETQNIRFEVQPFKYEFEVHHDDLTIETLFQIGGFTIMGSVVNKLSSGERFKGAQVVLHDKNGKNAEIQAVVDPNKGTFSAENIKTSNYLIQTTAPHYLFEDLDFFISPNTPHLPVISPSKFEICSKITFRSVDSKYDDINLIVQDKAKHTIVESVPIDEQNICLFLAGGHYLLKIESKYPELQFIPDVLELNVQKPELNIAFEQFTTDISGHVEFLKQATIGDEQLKITLATSINPQKIIAKTKPTPLSANNFEFKFSNVLPGEYVISLEGNLKTLYCWDNDMKTVKISDKAVGNIVFKQKGTLLQLSLSHATNLTIQSPSGKKVKIDKTSIGPERILRQCVNEVGKYQITPRGCHKFSTNDQSSFVFDTTVMAGQVLSLTANQHLVTAYIRSASNLSDLSVKILVNSLGEQRTRELKLTEFQQLKSPNDQTPIYQYTIEFYESPLVDIRLEPISSQLLFKPAFFEFKLKDDCYENAVIFYGRFGIFIDGLIKPNIKDVQINVIDSETNEVLFQTASDSDGKYFCGPFDDDLKLRIEAVKEGFVMKSIVNKLGHFEAQELCSISTTSVDQNGEPLSDVLVSVSGGENNFRKNSVTNSDGTLHFENLQPGQYFIRFSRKEFEFEPASKMITVGSSDHHVTRVVGKKVAFSCLGVVDSLNREPESGVVVEAVGLRNLVETGSIVCSEIQEQSVTEADGSFRILGLLPECQYAIRLKMDDNNNIVRSIPRMHLVRVNGSDITDLRFIVLFKVSQMDVSVRVKTQDHYISSLNVQLYKSEEPNVVISKQSLSSSPFAFFPPIPLDNKQYSIRIDSDLSTHVYRHSSIVHTFTANQSHLHLDLEFTPVARHTSIYTNPFEHEVPSSPLYSIPLLIVAFMFYYNKQLLEYLKNFAQHREQLMSLLYKVRRSSVHNSENGTKKKLKAKKVN